ncbi:hypothetical protein BDA96_03G072900, partial [Sorghum bicolor]
ANKGHVPIIYLYHNNSSSDAAMAGFFNVARLKEAMAKALVAFYPLAGRLGVSSDGRMEITCNDEGALFVVARAPDLTADEVKAFKPSPELRNLLVPRIEPSSSSIIMAIQVTFLKCGGVALGTALHHISSDASSAFHFFQTWSAFSKHGDHAVMELPCHDLHPDALLTLHPKLIFSNPSGPLATKVFTISRAQIASLKHRCGDMMSTFCVVSALVWQCTCIARRLVPDSKVCLSFPIDLRRRMRPPLPNHYFGNAVFRLDVTSTARDIAKEALGSIAGRIKGVIDRMDEELVRSAIDYFEMAQIGSRPPKGTLPQTDLYIVSWFGRPHYDVDFGWGKPQLMSLAEHGSGGCVCLMNNEGTTHDVGGSSDIRVVMCMEAVNMKELQWLLGCLVQRTKL